VSGNIKEKIADLIMEEIQDEAKEAAQPTIEALKNTGIEMTPEREEIICAAFKKILFAAFASHIIAKEHPGITAEELEELLEGEGGPDGRQ